MINIYNHLDTIRSQSSDDKYSRNLYRWLHKMRSMGRPAPQVFLQLGNELCQVDEHDPEANQASAMYLGFADNGDVFGAHLPAIITRGSNAPRFCYPGFALPKRHVDITDIFWSRYLDMGKCAIDPEHSLYAERGRYDGDSQLRTCRWCGQQEQAAIEIQTQHLPVWRPAHQLCPLPFQPAR